MIVLFAYIFSALAILVSLFQTALIFGAPFGEYTLGDRFPSKLPLKMRFASLLQIIILLSFASVVLSKAGIAFHSINEFAKTGIWIVLVFL